MKSKAVKSFWNQYRALPADIQQAARKQYRLWIQDPHHASVQFKKVGVYWSARVTSSYRAVGIMDGDTVVWFFIGTHDDYTRLLS